MRPPRRKPRQKATLLLLAWALYPCLQAQTQHPPQIPNIGDKNAGTSTSAKPPDTASDTTLRGWATPAYPATIPRGPTHRPRIGLALGGGGAVAMSEVGVLEYLEDHHIPVDLIAGTSMGAMVGALYSTGQTVDQLKVVMTNSVFNSVFSFDSPYKSRSFRRREDTRDLPNALTIGLKHGVYLRNSILVDQGLNAFLDRQFLSYDDHTDFNDLPIPFRCVSTDLNDASAVTFVRGSLPDAVRASVSLPGIYRPFLIDGHNFVDGAVLENLPTQTALAMHADVILAVSLPFHTVTSTDLNSILGVLERSFGVAIEANEAASRKLANVVLEPDVSGFSDTDYLKTAALAERGYQAAEKQSAALLPYAVNDAEWNRYLAERAARRRGPPGPLLRITVQAPSPSVTRAVQQKFSPLVGLPIDTHAIDTRLDEVRSDGRYNADYTIGYEPSTTSGAPCSSTASSSKNVGPSPTTPGTPSPATSPQAVISSSCTPHLSSSEPSHEAQTALPNPPPDAPRPSVLVTVTDKSTGPPFLLVGANVEGQVGGITRATAEGILLNQDLGGYGSELRSHIVLGFLTLLDTEYYRRLSSLSRATGGLFLAPHGGLLRQPYYIFDHQQNLAERQLQRAGGGLDLGWTNASTQELRLGWRADNIRWQTSVGSDGQPNIFGASQRGRVLYTFDSQDRALVPQFGIRSTTEIAYLYHTVASPNAPVLTTRLSLAHQIGKNVFIFASEAGTMLNRNVAQPFRFTLGGPLRLSASAIDEYRGTDYFLLEPAILRRIASLPAPLGQNIYLGAGYEAGQMHAPATSTITRQDVYFGIVAETPFGIITLAPALGDDGHRKFVFTLGKLF